MFLSSLSLESVFPFVHLVIVVFHLYLPPPPPLLGIFIMSYIDTIGRNDPTLRHTGYFCFQTPQHKLSRWVRPNSFSALIPYKEWRMKDVYAYARACVCVTSVCESETSNRIYQVRCILIGRYLQEWTRRNNKHYNRGIFIDTHNKISFLDDMYTLALSYTLLWHMFSKEYSFNSKSREYILLIYPLPITHIRFERLHIKYNPKFALEGPCSYYVELDSQHWNEPMHLYFLSHYLFVSSPSYILIGKVNSKLEPCEEIG